MRALEREAMRRWPHYAAQLEEETGMSIGFRQDGQIKVSLQEYKSKLDKDLTLRTSQQETFKVADEPLMDIIRVWLSGCGREPKLPNLLAVMPIGPVSPCEWLPCASGRRCTFHHKRRGYHRRS